ncbi:hypothetical protein [Streptomyces coeruleorubidus]|uniref:hypothetical protein n=1 Tax=Streptomyces coeruleorubidus TaxID=116188 RepID=UPI0033B044AA
MNLYPGDSIDVGVTRAPAPEPAAAPTPRLDPAAITSTKIDPGTVITLADTVISSNSTTGKTTPRLDAAFFADKERVLAMVAHWSRDELYTLGNVLMGEGDRRINGELLEVLRAMFASEREESPARKVEFVTDPNYNDGVFWSEDTVYLHDADGSVSPFSDFAEEGEEGVDPAYAALDERFRDLLADYSRSDHPNDGDHLVVDLVTGEFDRSGKWSLV